MHHISFEVTRVPDVNEDNEPCQRAWVSAVIDGHRVGTAGAPVDFYQVLACRGLTTEHTFLTCSCGVAGCAGYHRDTFQQWGPEVVEWHLDAEEYRHLAFALPSPSNAEQVVLRFSTEQLELALSELEKNLRQAMESGPVHFSPGGDLNSTDSADDLAEDLAAQRAWVLKVLEREKREQQVFGALSTSTIVAYFPEGFVMEANGARAMKHLLHVQADAAGLHTSEEVDLFVESAMDLVWRDQVTREPSTLLNALVARPWDEVFLLWHCVSEARPHASPAWDRATLTLLLSDRR